MVRIATSSLYKYLVIVIDGVLVIRGPTEHFVGPSQAEPPTSLVTFRKLYFALCVF